MTSGTMTQATRWPLPPRRSQWRSWQQNLSSQTILCNLDPVQSCAICTDQPQKPMVTSCTNTSQKEPSQKDMAAHGHQGSPAEGGRFRSKVSDSEYFKVRSNMHKVPRVQHTRGIRSPKGTDKPRKLLSATEQQKVRCINRISSQKAQGSRSCS